MTAHQRSTVVTSLNYSVKAVSARLDLPIDKLQANCIQLFQRATRAQRFQLGVRHCVFPSVPVYSGLGTTRLLRLQRHARRSLRGAEFRRQISLKNRTEVLHGGEYDFFSGLQVLHC